MSKPALTLPTEAEDLGINHGILQDPDNPEWTDEEFADAVLAAALVDDLTRPDLVPALADALRRRGPQRTPTKEAISLRLDRDVLERWRATGPGWQARMNDVLRKAVSGGR